MPRPAPAERRSRCARSPGWPRGSRRTGGRPRSSGTATRRPGARGRSKRASGQGARPPAKASLQVPRSAPDRVRFPSNHRYRMALPPTTQVVGRRGFSQAPGRGSRTKVSGTRATRPPLFWLAMHPAVRRVLPTLLLSASALAACDIPTQLPRYDTQWNVVAVAGHDRDRRSASPRTSASARTAS